MNYIIDPQIISYFLNEPVDSDKVSQYLQTYQNKIANISGRLIYDYSKTDLGLSDDEINVELQKLIELGDEPPKFFSDELIENISREIENLNEQIYSYYGANLPDERFQKVNSYIDDKVDEAKNIFDDIKAAALDELKKIEEEYRQTGNVKSWEEAHPESDSQTASIPEPSDKFVPSENINTNPAMVDPILGV